jgi:hypothetical protein
MNSLQEYLMHEVTQYEGPDPHTGFQVKRESALGNSEKVTGSQSGTNLGFLIIVTAFQWRR